jgi:predicted nucleic acid-binding protein
MRIALDTGVLIAMAGQHSDVGVISDAERLRSLVARSDAHELHLPTPVIAEFMFHPSGSADFARQFGVLPLNERAALLAGEAARGNFRAGEHGRHCLKMDYVNWAICRAWNVDYLCTLDRDPMRINQFAGSDMKVGDIRALIAELGGSSADR